MEIGRHIKFILIGTFVLFSLSNFNAFARGEDAQPLKDGAYEGKAFKFPGWMKVEVSIKNGKMTGIKIMKQMAIKKYWDMLQPLIDEIIKKQSTKVDAITGATMSSNALKKAVADALYKARL